MTKAIGNTTSSADNSTPKKTYFDWQKAQEQWTKSSLFTKPFFEDPYNTPSVYPLIDDYVPTDYVSIQPQKHMIATEFYVDENGNIDMSQLSRETIEAKYSDKNKFCIEPYKNYLWVYEKTEDGNERVSCIIRYEKDFINYEQFQYINNEKCFKAYKISTTGELLTASYKDADKEEEVYEYNNNYLVSKYNKGSFDQEEIAYENLKKELAINYIDQHNISKIKIDIYQRLSKKNIIGTFKNFDIITAIEKSKALPESEKEKMISHVTNLLYDADKKVLDSKIENEHYQSNTEYDAYFMPHSIRIHSRNPFKLRWIDFWNIFKYGDNNEFEQVRLQKLLQELPPEALMDFATEVQRFKIQYINSRPEEAGHYSYDNTPQGSGKDETISVQQELETLVHEIGHAMDFSYNNPEKSNQSKACNSEKFQEAFYSGMHRYKTAGYTRFSNDKNYKSVERQEYEALTWEEQLDRHYKCDSNYCTYKIEEMMAECYTLLILGDCQSKNVILKYFPECLECAKEIIEETRNLPDEERIKP